MLYSGVMMKTEFNVSDLNQFSGGSENFYRHSLCRNVSYTEGVRYLAREAKCYWLIDAIAIPQATHKAVKMEGFQVWKLKVAADNSAKLTCEDGNGGAVYSQHIDFTDFPAEEITLWVCDNTGCGDLGFTIMLPCEY